MESKFTGLATALITPLNEDCTIHYEKLGELVERQIRSGVNALVVCGTTGEASTLSVREQQSVIQYVYEKSNYRIPVIAGVGSNNTEQAVLLAKQAEKIGVDSILSVVPYYNTPSQEGIYEHFFKISQSVSTPIILYNIPSRTGRGITPETIWKLLQHTQTIVGIKECVFDNAVKIKEHGNPDFSIYAGNDDLAAKMAKIGGNGLISTVSNIIPEFMVNYMRSIEDEEIKQIAIYEKQLSILLKGIFIPEETNPGTTKALMNHLGVQVGPCRLPITQPKGVHLKQLIEQWNQFTENTNY